MPIQSRRRLRRLAIEPLCERKLLAADFSFVPTNLTQIEVAQRSGDLAFEPVESPLEISFIYGQAIRSDPVLQQIVERAANQWRRHIKDPATVIINIDLVSLPSNILGGAISETMMVPYGDLREALINDAALENDDAIIASLPTEAQLQFTTSSDVFVGASDLEGVDIEVNRATAKAIGLLDPNDPAYVLPDASIVINSNAFFFGGPGDAVGGDDGGSDGGGDPGGGNGPPLPPDVDPEAAELLVTGLQSSRDDAIAGGPLLSQGSDNGAGSLSDITTFFEATVVHEIGHALGFISSLDELTPASMNPTTMDLFRFASDVRNLNPESATDFATFPRELRSEVNAVLNFVEDAWDIGRVSYPVERGETASGFQASHWLDQDLAGENIGLMDPTGGPGSPVDLTFADLRLFDVIGWDIAAPGDRLPSPAVDPRILPQDVNGDGQVSAIDALFVINQLALPDDFDASIDVNRDGAATPIDALLVINYLAKQDIASVGSEQGFAHDADSALTVSFLGERLDSDRWDDVWRSIDDSRGMALISLGVKP